MIQRKWKLFSLLAIAAVALGTLASRPTATAQGKVTSIRDIQDFVEVQRQNPFAPSWVNGDGTILAVVDYAGVTNWQAETWFGYSFGTETSGTVTERVLRDGRTEVHVVLHTENALTFAVDLVEPGFPFLFGNLAGAVVFGGAEPALGDSLFELTYITPDAPGSPMPELTQLFFNPAPGEEVVQLLLNVRADGEMHEAAGVEEGTPGRLTMIMRGLFQTPSQGALEDGFPADFIRIRAVGQ